MMDELINQNKKQIQKKNFEINELNEEISYLNERIFDLKLLKNENNIFNKTIEK